MVSLSLFSKSRTECASWTGTFCFAFWVDSKGGRRPSFGAGSSNRGAEHPCWRGIPKGAALLWPEESKETGGFVAGNPTGTASPWHTTLHEVRQRRTSESDCLQSPSEASERRRRLMAGIAKYSVLYLRLRLTGKRSVLLQERSFCTAGKRAGFCEWERAET